MDKVPGRLGKSGEEVGESSTSWWMERASLKAAAFQSGTQEMGVVFPIYSKASKGKSHPSQETEAMGKRLRATDEEARQVEATIACQILNRFLELGRSESIPVG